MKKRKRSKGKSKSRWLSLKVGAILTAAFALWATASVWFVHHPASWIAEACESYPRIVTAPLLLLGNPVGDFTDALGWTGHDAVYEYDEAAPSGQVFFAGAPKRTGAPAPNDIQIVDRGEFAIGWSPSLRHPVWVAYHVTPESRFGDERRNFTRDKAVPTAPAPNAYERSGYDRGHLAPNHALATRYGEAVQKRTFLMSNIAPQSPALNRGVWRDVEHRIADLWTARYGEIWVIVGCIPSTTGEALSGTDIDVPSACYQIVIAEEKTSKDEVAEEKYRVRAFAVLFPQDVSWSAWPTRHLISIEELEKRAGLDFLPGLPSFIASPLKAELPSRLWPIRLGDVFKLISIRFPAN